MELKMVHDITGLKPVMPQAKNVITAKHVSLDDYLSLFDKSVHEKILATLEFDGATHVVCFENLDMWSSQFGHRTSIVVGSKQGQSLEKVLTTPYARIGEVPSRFQYPVAYASRVTKEVKKARPKKKVAA